MEADSDKDEVHLCFASMTEPELRQWIESNPKRVNAWDSYLYQPLHAAIEMENVPLVLWLIKEKGADINGECPALFCARTVNMLNALLECGADPALNSDGLAVIDSLVHSSELEMVARLLQEPRAKANVNAQDILGVSALHTACEN